MPDDIITLVPSVGDSLALTGTNYALGMEVDWGEHVIDPQLAGGSDVVGGVPGVRKRCAGRVLDPGQGPRHRRR